MKIKMISKSGVIPEYKTEGASGMDIRAYLDGPLVINNGDRIAQMVIAKYEKVEIELTDSLEETERGAGGFGHTGI